MTKHILVIDDDEGIRKSFTLALKGTGYQVDTAESGEIGLEKQQEAKYDLCFLDLKMPGINGVETLREIRQIDEKVPVYIVTAFHREFFDQLQSAIDDGMEFEVCKKPITNDQIVLLVKSALEGPESYEDLTTNKQTVTVLKVYVMTRTAVFEKKLKALESVLDERFKHQYDLEVIDVRKHPQLLEDQKIWATPTLVKERPDPIRKIVGDIGNTKEVLVALDLV